MAYKNYTYIIEYIILYFELKSLHILVETHTHTHTLEVSFPPLQSVKTEHWTVYLVNNNFIFYTTVTYQCTVTFWFLCYMSNMFLFMFSLISLFTASHWMDSVPLALIKIIQADSDKWLYWHYWHLNRSHSQLIIYGQTVWSPLRKRNPFNFHHRQSALDFNESPAVSDSDSDCSQIFFAGQGSTSRENAIF